MARRAVVGDPLQVDPLVGGQAPGALGELLLGEQARLDTLGQLDLLLGVEQRHLADLLQVVLDRVGRRAGHRDLRGGQILVVVAEDQDLLVVAAVRGDLDHAGPGYDGSFGFRGGLARFRPVGRLAIIAVVGRQLLCDHVLGHVLAHQVVGGRGHVSQVGLVQVTAGERGLDVLVVRVEVAELVTIQIGTIQIGRVVLADSHGSQSGVRVNALPGTVLAGTPGSRTGKRPGPSAA